MGIKKEFFCPAHGDFEAEEPVCPRGCTVVQRAFRTAPGFSSKGTRGVDKLLEEQARAYGVTDFNNHNGTTAARVHSPQVRAALEHQEAIRKKYPSNWGALPSSDQGGAVAAMKQYGTPPSVDMQSVKESPKPPVTYVRDPDTHSVEKVKRAAA